MRKNLSISPQSIAHIGLMTAITVGFSFVKIPFFIPFTLQTLACMLAGLLLQPRDAILSQLIYVFLGLFGLPVFTAGGGFSYVLYPTFGYILYMPVMAGTIALLKGRNIVLSLFLGIVPLLLFGMMYYYFIVTLVQDASQQLGKLFTILVLPFLPSELLKAVAAFLIYHYLPANLKKSSRCIK